jgi:hypothetical protein
MGAEGRSGSFVHQTNVFVGTCTESGLGATTSGSAQSRAWTGAVPVVTSAARRQARGTTGLRVISDVRSVSRLGAQSQEQATYHPREIAKSLAFSRACGAGGSRWQLCCRRVAPTICGNGAKLCHAQGSGRGPCPADERWSVSALQCLAVHTHHARQRGLGARPARAIRRSRREP